ncbi:MAG: hypothetical protein ABI325_04710 [Ginsengibacter sp.]
MLTYPMGTARNFYEILRTLDSLQLDANHKVSIPVYRNYGEDVIVSPALSEAEMSAQFPVV